MTVVVSEREIAMLEQLRERAQEDYEAAHQRIGGLRRDVIHAEADLALALAEGADAEAALRVVLGTRAELRQARVDAEPLLDRFLGRQKAVSRKRAQTAARAEQE